MTLFHRSRRRCLPLLLAFLMFTAALVLPAGAATRYLVTAEGAPLLAAPEENAETVGALPAGLYVYVTEEAGAYCRVSVRSTGLSGWTPLALLRPADETAENPARIKSIYIKTLPKKTVYIAGEDAFDETGLAVWASFTDGRADAPLTGWSLYLPSFATAGKKTVYVRYRSPAGGVSFGAAFPVTVQKVPVAGMEILSLPNKTEYREHETLSLAGLKLRVRFSDDRAERIFTADEVLSDPDFAISGTQENEVNAPLAAGEHTLVISYKYPEIRVSLTVRAAPRKLNGIALTTPPNNPTAYSNTEPPTLDGAVVTAFFDNGENEEIPIRACEILCDPASFVIGEGNKVTIAYEGFTTTLTMRYIPDTPVAIKVVTPRILTFILGEPVELNDMRVYQVFASGAQAELSAFIMSDIDPKRTGAQTVTVQYGEFSDLFTIYINPYYQKGDVDGDGEVTAMDARFALRASVDLIRLANNPLKAADTDGDGNVTAMDARKILRASVDLERLIF